MRRICLQVECLKLMFFIPDLSNCLQEDFRNSKFQKLKSRIVDFVFDLANLLISTVTLNPYKSKKQGFKSLSKVNQSYAIPFGLTLD
jgi:hypothetical protein